MENDQIAKRGDTIEWEVDSKWIIEKFGKTIFQDEVAMINHEEKYYGVYCEYGQDHIPFDKAKIIKNENK